MSLKGFYPELFQLRLLQELLQDSPLYLFLCSKSSLKSNNKKTNKQTNAKTIPAIIGSYCFFVLFLSRGKVTLKGVPLKIHLSPLLDILCTIGPPALLREKNSASTVYIGATQHWFYHPCLEQPSYRHGSLHHHGTKMSLIKRFIFLPVSLRDQYTSEAFSQSSFSSSSSF